MKGKTALILLSAAVLIGIAAAGMWFRAGSGLRKPPGAPSTAFRSGSTATPAVIRVHLYFGDREGSYLTAESRSIPAGENPEQLGRAVITALLDGPQNDLTPLLPPGTALRAFFHPPGDIAYVDIEPAAEGLPGGARSELLAVFSIVNSLVLNVPPIEQVKLLVAGREVDTLGGHVVLRDPLAADMLLVR